MPDAEMKSAQAEIAETTKSKAKSEPSPPPIPEILLALLRHNLALVHRSVVHLEARFSIRALRNLPTARRRISEYPDVLARIISEATPQDSQTRKDLLSVLPQPYQPLKVEEAPAVEKKDDDSMDIDGKDDKKSKDTKKEEDTAATEAKKDAKPQPPKDLSAKPSEEAQPELDAYLKLLVAVYLIDGQKTQQVSSSRSAAL